MYPFITIMFIDEIGSYVNLQMLVYKKASNVTSHFNFHTFSLHE